MRTLTGAAVTALSQPTVALAMLIRISLTSELFLNTSAWNLPYGGNTYLGTGAAGRIDTIEDSPGEVRGLRLALSGVPSSVIALALSEPVQGKPVSLSLAIFSNTTYQVLDVSNDWQGRADIFSIAENGETCTLSVTAEHAGIDLLRPRVVRYTNADQQRLYPNDLGFQYVVDQSDIPIVWPSKDFFKK